MSSNHESELRLLRQRIVDLEGRNIELGERVEQLEQLRADVSVAGLVQSLALEVALGEATMPDHAVTPVSISASTYLVPSGGGLGLRFHTPELGEAKGLSSTSLELAKVPSPAPGNTPPGGGNGK